MNNLTATLLAITLFAPAISFGADGELEQSCWEAVKEVSPRISSDLTCVTGKAGEAFSKLCASDGIQATKEFRAYLVLRDRYLAVKSEAAEWLAANPGATQYPPGIAAKIKNAENAWMIAGKRYQVEDQIEKVRRASATCK